MGGWLAGLQMVLCFVLGSLPRIESRERVIEGVVGLGQAGRPGRVPSLASACFGRWMGIDGWMGEVVAGAGTGVCTHRHQQLLASCRVIDR